MKPVLTRGLEKFRPSHNLRALCDAQGLSLRTLSLETGLALSTLSRVRNDQRRTTGDTAVRLAEYFKVGVQFFLHQ